MNTKKILAWYEQFMLIAKDLGLDLTKPEHLLRIRGYIKPNLEVEPKQYGEVFFPLAKMSIAPVPEEEQRYCELKAKTDALNAEYFAAGEAIEEAHSKGASEDKLKALKETYIGVLKQAQEVQQICDAFKASVLVKFYNALEASTTLPDINNPADFPIIDKLFNLSCERLLTIEGTDVESGNYNIIGTDENGQIIVSKKASEIDEYDPFALALVNIDTARHMGFGTIEGKEHDQGFIADRNDFYVTVNAFRDSYIIDGSINEGIVLSELMQISKQMYADDYKRVIVSADKYIKEKQSLTIPKGMEERFTKIENALKHDNHTNEIVKVRIDADAPLVDTFTKVQMADYQALLDWYEKEDLHFKSAMNILRLMSETEKNPDGTDKGTFSKEVIDEVIPNLAALSRLNAHKLQGSYTASSAKQIKAEIQALVDFDIFRKLVSETISQEMLMSTLEGPGMRTLDRSMRLAIQQGIMRAKNAQ